MLSEAITRTMAEATRVVLQMMAEVQAQRTQNAAGPKLGGPAQSSLHLTGKHQIGTQNSKHLS